MEVVSGQTQVEGLAIHYREAGSGPPVLLLHGWPTSSALWRNVMPPMAAHNRVVAIDLPGFGRSDKPLDASYSFRFFDRILDGFLEQLQIDRLGLVVHDLGGPVGLHWAVQRLERIERLALLNTLVYPRPSWAVIAFVAAARLPGLRSLLTSPWGLERALHLGVVDPGRLADDAVESFQAPFRERDARRALAKAGIGLHPGGLRTIAEGLPAYEGPLRIVYGAQDRILPDIERTVARLSTELPQAEVTALPGCGHFLQEERPEHLGELLAAFFGGEGSVSAVGKE